MNRRSFQVLAALAAGLLLLVLFVERTGQESPGSVGERLLPSLEAHADAVEQIAIDLAGDAQDVTVTRSGDAWVVTSRDDYPADVGTLRQLVGALAEARIVEEKTAIAENYARIGVDDPEAGGSGTLVHLRGEDFEASVIIGNAAQRDYRYMRVAGAGQSYLVDRNPELPGEAGGWLDRGIIDVAADRIRRVEIVHADGETVAIEKAGDEASGYTVRDIPAGRELSYPTVGDGIARALEDLALDDVRRETDGAPAATATFETADGLTVTVRAIEADGQTWFAFAASADEDEERTAEAAAINARTARWWYALPEHKAGLFTRRWEDLLADEDSDD